MIDNATLKKDAVGGGTPTVRGSDLSTGVYIAKLKSTDGWMKSLKVIIAR